MTNQHGTDSRWLIVKLKKQLFGLPIQEVQGLITKPQITTLPESADCVRGVLNARGKTIPILDLRKRLGMISASAETDAFCSLMEQRRQDHVHWLNTLEAAIRDHGDFRLATNPHECAFGRWYDTYKPDNVWIEVLLKRFAEPHGRIHAVAGQALEMSSRGNQAGAMALIEHARTNVLATMLALFNDLTNLVTECQQEIAVVLQTASHVFAVCVDEAVAVERFDEDHFGALPSGVHDGLVRHFGSRGTAGPLVLMVATERLMEVSV